MKEQAVDRFPDDVDRGEKQQGGFDEGGEAFHFSVAVEMVCVGRLVCDANGEEGDHGGDEVENGMQRFGQNSEAAGDHGEENF